MNYDRISTFREVCYKQKMKYKKKTLMKITLKKEIQFFIIMDRSLSHV